MDKFDEKVIGYDSIKETLRQIADVLKRPEAYKEKGVSMPRGLLMESAPGLGKSLMASILMEESGRKSFVFRRINEGNTFLGEMKDIFDVAKEEAPSILLLEDLNLYVESNSPYAPEWACLQACIDETSDADIFVIATTNDTRYMPQSLLRPGRFDYILNLNPPLGKTAEDIVSYYLRDKNLAKDVQIGHCIKGHNLSSLDFNDKSSEFLFVEIHCTLRQGSQIPFVVTSGQKSRPGKNIGSIPQRTIERQAKQLAFIIADQCDL